MSLSSTFSSVTSAAVVSACLAQLPGMVLNVAVLHGHSLASAERPGKLLL